MGKILFQTSLPESPVTTTTGRLCLHAKKHHHRSTKQQHQYNNSNNSAKYTFAEFKLDQNIANQS
jgi:hypothetical protein